MQGLSCQASEFTLGIHPVAIKPKFGNTMSRTMATAWSSRLRTLPFFFVVVILGLVTNSRWLLHWVFVGASGSKLGSIGRCFLGGIVRDVVGGVGGMQQCPRMQRG